MATNTFDFEAYEEWADTTAERDGSDLAEFFTNGRD